MTAEESTGPTIAIINYGMGNWRSAQRAFDHVGANAPRTADRQEILAADGLVLPGVGAFPSAMERLVERDLISTISEFNKLGKPILGICLGHQLLFEASEEHEYTKGLGFLPGAVKRPIVDKKIVNMGWSPVGFTRDTALNDEVPAENFYHMHEYAVVPDDDSIVFARSAFPVPSLGASVWTVAGVQRDNLYGVQFHPEKSSAQGLKLLENFVQVCRDGPTEI